MWEKETVQQLGGVLVGERGYYRYTGCIQEGFNDYQIGFLFFPSPFKLHLFLTKQSTEAWHLFVQL